MFYLNRTGAPEGPYEEGRILAMIHAGEVAHANICPVGHNQWAPINSHPPFAQALAQRQGGQGSAHAPGHAGAAPAAAGYGYAAPAPAYTPPPAAGYAPPAAAYAPHTAPAAAPSGGYGAPPTASGAYNAPSGAQARPRSTGSNHGGRMILILAIAGIAVVFLVGTAIGAYMLFFGGGAPTVSASVPRDLEVFIEMPSLKRALLDMKDIEFMETSARDDKKVIEDTVSAVSRSFDISEGDARNFLIAAESAGVGMRKLTTNEEVVVVLGFQRSGPVDALLQSRRFTAAGALGQGGKKYNLTKKLLADKTNSDMTFRSLSELEVSGQREILVWFPDQKVLVFGSDALVADCAKVIESGAPPLRENSNFANASKDFPSDARVVGFVDPSVLASVTDRSAREIIDSYFKPAGPMTMTVRLKPAGVLMSFAGRFMGTKLPKASSHEAAIKLTLSDRLPAETFVYAAFSTKSRMTGAEVEKTLLDQIGAAEPRARPEIERGLREIEQLLGVTMQKVYESLGEQAALAVLAPYDFAIDQAQGPQAFGRFALVYVQQLKDEAALKAASQQLKTKVLPAMREVSVTDDGAGGFVLTPRDAPFPVTLRAKFLDRHLFLTAGATALNERAEAAFSRGERTLKDDAAHKGALGALPDASHFLLWLDTGRTADTLMKSPLVKTMVESAGFQISQFKLSGNQRITTALAARADVENETWTYRVDTLNLHGAAPLAGGAALMGGGGALTAPPPGLPPGFP